MKRKISLTCGVLLWLCSLCLSFLGAEAAGPAETGSNRADTLEFELFDVFGRKVCSADYAGLPILLEFGACW